jgi:dihydroxyacetone kinase-like predicted kinase
MLTVQKLQKIVLVFCDHIINKKNEINSINVFPVPDQDTGSNLAITFREVKKVIWNRSFESIDSLADTFENTALLAAQGNSGIIFVGFFSGFFEALRGKSTISTQDLSAAFKEGSIRARKSIEKPAKGTILDVIDAAANSLHEDVENENTIWERILFNCFNSSSKALENTRSQMALLKEAKVVDAGGLAFVIFIESFYEAISGRKMEIKEEHSKVKLLSNAHSITNNRYEVVCIIEESFMKQDEVENMLTPLGDSIDILEIQSKMKIHIHTDQPQTVKEICGNLGNMTFLQLSDMKEEKILELIKE